MIILAIVYWSVAVLSIILVIYGILRKNKALTLTGGLYTLIFITQWLISLLSHRA